MIRFFIAVLLLALTVAGAHAFGMGRFSSGFSKLGSLGQMGVAPAVSCASPTAPNGVVDLSQCSNSYYVAVIF